MHNFRLRGINININLNFYLEGFNTKVRLNMLSKLQITLTKMKKRIGIILSFAILGMGNLMANPTEQDTIDYFNLSLEELMNIEIVAVSKKAESSFDAPLSSSIITRDEIINTGATTLEELFRLVPGFIVREESNGNYDVHIRGNDNIPSGNLSFFSENSMTLVMVDGRKVFNHMNGGTFWESIPVSLTDIERIEIIRGASTALYGPNAVSGVINFITKKSPDKAVTIDGNFMYGSANTMVTDLAINTSSTNNKFKARISTNYEQRDRFESDYYSYTSGKYEPYSALIYYPRSTSISEDDPRFKDKNLAKQKSGLNGWLNYDLNEDVNFNLSAGVQNSLAQTVAMESSLTPLTFRESETYYFNSINQIHGFNIQLTGTFGNQDIYKNSSNVSKVDMQTIDAVVEYDLTLGDLTLRPGVSYQNIVYDDTPYATGDLVGQGYFNQVAKLNNFAYYLRGDYMATDRLRLIAALRMDQYNHPNDNYFTYQFIATYKPNDNNLLRASISRANRGPVMVDFYADASYGSINEGILTQYLGDNDLKLTTSDVIEVGYRGKLSDKLQLDIEAFYSTITDFPTFDPVIAHIPSLPSEPYLQVIYQYQNMDVKAKQLGTTFSFLYAPSTKIQVKAFATIQKTTLENFEKKTTPMITYFGANIPSSEWVFANPTYEMVDQTHKNTPSVYGGLTANYRPADKWNIFASLNYYSEQTYEHDYANSQYYYFNQTGSGIANIPASVNLNAKVSYKLYKNNSVFLNARNLLGSSEPEFGFADQRGLLLLGGININL